MSLLSLPVAKSGVQDAETCRTCGGMCCLMMPGCAFPDDFGDGADSIRELLTHALRTGFWAVDWYEGDPRPRRHSVGRAYFIRPATVEAKRAGRIKDPSWGGVCALWCDGHGCSLEFNERPRECRELVPVRGGDCKVNNKHSKRAAAIAWLPYTEMIESILSELEQTR